MWKVKQNMLTRRTISAFEEVGNVILLPQLLDQASDRCGLAISNSLPCRLTLSFSHFKCSLPLWYPIGIDDWTMHTSSTFIPLRRALRFFSILLSELWRTSTILGNPKVASFSVPQFFCSFLLRFFHEKIYTAILCHCFFCCYFWEYI